MKTCEVCTRELLQKVGEGNSRFAQRKLCSLKCRQIYLTGRRHRDFVPPTCRECQKTIDFHGQKRQKRRKFCDNVCAAKARSGTRHYKWRGGIKKCGKYLMEFVGKQHPFNQAGFIMQHRKVVEDWLRTNKPSSDYLVVVNGERYLNRSVIVHHKDHNKHNNVLENLQPVFTQLEHFSQHYCPHCTHCNKSGELLETPSGTISNQATP